MTRTEQWQRLAPLALVFLLIGAVQKLIRENLFLFAGAGFGAAVFDWIGLRELVLIGLVGLAASVIGAIIFHHRFRFRIDHDAVRVRRGLFEKTEVKVRFARVQSVQINQPFYFRPFGLVRFTVETPGAEKAEVELPGIDRELAEAMRDAIVGLRQGNGTGHGPAEPVESVAEGNGAAGGRELYRAGSGRLFRHGLSSNQIWVLAGLLAYFSSALFERYGKTIEDTAWMAWLFDHLDTLWLLIVALLVVLFPVLLVLSGLLAIVRFHGFRLSDRGERMVSVAGLLDQREQTVRRDKITGLTLKQSAIGRLLDSWQLIVRQTASQTQQAADQRPSFLIPGLGTDDRQLLGELVPGRTWPEGFAPISPRYRRVFGLRLTSASLIIGAAALWLLSAAPVTLAILPVLVVVTGCGVHLRYRHWGWSLHAGELWVRQGLLGRRLDGFDLDRVQQIRVTQSPYQRRHRLATLGLILPQGTISLPWLSLDQAAQLANQAVFAAESAAVHRV